MNYREYWTTTDVPAHTGAINAQGTEDLEEVLAALHVDLADLAVIDVGCGTGRLAPLCGQYVGLDVAPSQVAYAKAQGLDAYLIDGPADLDLYEAEANIVCCFSVFTHVDRDTRRKYLGQFTRLAQRTLVDILPGSSESGGIPAWYTASSDFELDLLDAGFQNFDSYDRRSGDGYLHRYYLAW